MVTLSQKSPDFLPFLRGTFSKSHRALPVQSRFVGTTREEVTFQIVPLEKIEIPSALIFGNQLLRIMKIVPTGFILWIAWLYLRFFEAINIPYYFFISSALGAMSLHAAVYLFNDYYDHIKGLDRLNSFSGSRIIQKGWLTAYQVFNLAVLFILLSTLFSIPLILFHTKEALLLGSIGLIGVLGYSSIRLGFKYRGLAEVIVFLLLGPVLVLGFSWMATQQIHLKLLWLGLGYGGISASLIFLKNITNMMDDWQGKGKSLPLLLGFEKSKWFFTLIFAFTSLFFLLYSISAPFLWGGLITSIVFCYGGWIICQKVLHSSSCVASLMREALRMSSYLQLSMITLHVLSIFIEGWFRV